MSNKPVNTGEYRAFIQDVKQRIQAAQIKAAVAANGATTGAQIPWGHNLFFTSHPGGAGELRAILK